MRMLGYFYIYKYMFDQYSLQKVQNSDSCEFYTNKWEFIRKSVPLQNGQTNDPKQ